MLTFEQLRMASKARAEAWHGSLNHWSVMQWACAAAGEMGEACNVAKKMQRILDGIAKRKEELLPDSLLQQREKLAIEIADTIIYLDLLAARENIDLSEAIRLKFNKVSEEFGFIQRL
jgi:NTP pyrophosphatase (non-canonical NTP hydrolase)